MDQFANTARAQRPGMNHLIAEGVEHRLGALKDFSGAADHHFVDAARRAGLARRHRRVEEMGAFGAKQRSSSRSNDGGLVEMSM